MKKLCIIVFSVVVSGCVSVTAVKPKATDSKSIVSIIKSYSKASEAGLINPYLLLPGDGETKTGAFKAFSR